MSCDEIKINDDINEITIINTEDKFSVSDSDNVVTIVDNVDKFEVTEEVGDAIRINVTDVILSAATGRYDVFTPTNGQTIFTLSELSTGEEINLSKVFINGQKIAYVTCYTISGSQLTVILPYLLNNGDILEIYY
jgi:tRNA splicing ligase